MKPHACTRTHTHTRTHLCCHSRKHEHTHPPTPTDLDMRTCIHSNIVQCGQSRTHTAHAYRRAHNQTACHILLPFGRLIYKYTDRSRNINIRMRPHAIKHHWCARHTRVAVHAVHTMHAHITCYTYSSRQLLIHTLLKDNDKNTDIHT